MSIARSRPRALELRACVKLLAMTAPNLSKCPWPLGYAQNNPESVILLTLCGETVCYG